jgi:membrane protease YdiL (CAAX protease family)
VSFDAGIALANYLGIFNVPYVIQLNNVINHIAGENLYIVQRSFKFLLSIFLYTFFVQLSKDKNLLFIPRKKIKEGFFNGLAFRFTLDCVLWLFYLLIGDFTVNSLNISFSTIPYVAIIILAMFFTAFTEEIIFRGYLLNELAKGFNKHIASLAIAILFGYVHLAEFNVTGALSSGVFSLLLNYGFLWTKNIYFAIGMHFTANAMGRIAYSDEILNFGPSTISYPTLPLIGKIVIMGMGLWYLYMHYKKNKREI